MDLDRLNVREFLEQAVARNPGAPFLIWEDEELTYREFDDRVNAAAGLWHEIGVRKGDRVAFMADNSPGFLTAWLGLAKLGAVLVAVNTGFRQAEAGYLVGHSEARFALVEPQHAEMFHRIREDTPSLERTWSLGSAEGLEDFL